MLLGYFLSTAICLSSVIALVIPSSIPVPLKSTEVPLRLNLDTGTGTKGKRVGTDGHRVTLPSVGDGDGYRRGLVCFPSGVYINNNDLTNQTSSWDMNRPSAYLDGLKYVGSGRFGSASDSGSGSIAHDSPTHGHPHPNDNNPSPNSKTKPETKHLPHGPFRLTPNRHRKPNPDYDYIRHLRPVVLPALLGLLAGGLACAAGFVVGWGIMLLWVVVTGRVSLPWLKSWVAGGRGVRAGPGGDCDKKLLAERWGYHSRDSA